MNQYRSQVTEKLDQLHGATWELERQLKQRAPRAQAHTVAEDLAQIAAKLAHAVRERAA